MANVITWSSFMSLQEPDTITGVERVATRDGYVTPTQLSVTPTQRIVLASLPDLLTFGNITRDSNGAVTSADVVWPDGTTGTFTGTSLSTLFPGAVDAYTITYGDATYTQPLVTRDTTGAVTVRPEIAVS